MNAKELEEARKAAEEIIRSGESYERQGIDSKDLIDAGHGLLDALDEMEESGGAGGEGGGAGGKEEGEGAGAGEGEGKGRAKGGADDTEEHRAEAEANERGQPSSDRSDELDELWRVIARKEKQAEKNLKGPEVPIWVLVQGFGGREEGTENEVHLDAKPEFFLKARSKLSPAIVESRRLLARIMVPITQRFTYEKSGRFMARKLTQFYIESMSHPVERMYELDRSKMKNEAPAVAFVVDTSGSFQGMHPELHMVHLAEAFRQFQPPNRFAMYIFASYWARVKGFNEPWSAVDRIGDYQKAGGSTTLMGGLREALKQLSAVPYRTKLLVILSDFFTENVSDLIMGSRWGGVRVLPVHAGDYSDDEMKTNLPRRQIFFRVRDYSEVVRVMLEYLDASFKGYPPPGAYYTPDNPSGRIYQVPRRA